MILNLAGSLYFDLPSRRKSVIEWGDKLQQSGESVAGLIANATESDHNHETITHLIGIERWGQQRLKVALGERFIEDEYDGYRPMQETPFVALKEQFESTRQQTVELTEALRNVDASMKIKHNMFGGLSVRGWLRYLDTHANLTIKLLR